jgi:hypothetical protein
MAQRTQKRVGEYCYDTACPFRADLVAYIDPSDDARIFDGIPDRNVLFELFLNAVSLFDRYIPGMFLYLREHGNKNTVFRIQNPGCQGFSGALHSARAS